MAATAAEKAEADEAAAQVAEAAMEDAIMEAEAAAMAEAASEEPISVPAWALEPVAPIKEAKSKDREHAPTDSEVSAQRVCVTWRDQAHQGLVGHALFEEAFPPLLHVAAPLRVLTQIDGPAALLATVDGRDDVEGSSVAPAPEVVARAELALSLLASLDLLSALCEGRASHADGSPTRLMLPSMDLLHASTPVE